MATFANPEYAYIIYGYCRSDILTEMEMQERVSAGQRRFPV